ncbi:MAG: threonine synthase [Defluviitaleaceae bacterium]|nr:threonine synthase [Defluviitaleaceae bacterium]
MRYISTRGNGASVTAKEAILKGLALDGGLYVPENIPSISFEELLPLSYPNLAREILRPYLNFTEEELNTCVEQAYTTERFSHPLIAPLTTPFDDKSKSKIYFLELFHGPTLAFKDMALSILPYLMTISAKCEASGKELVILTATSGDTGKAALEAFCNVKGISIIVFYPEKGVSNLQKRQMITQEGDNTYVFGVKGNFDDAQTGVKKLFSDPNLAQDLAKDNKMFSSANSINIGRLLPQIVYYFYAYGQLVKEKNLQIGEKINFVVPTGNFGNILAGYYAKKMGLPINKLICASNDNKILYDFFQTGIYDKNREFYCTMSPSMDILISGNLERLLFHATDSNTVKTMMDALADKGRFETQISLPDFYGVYTTAEETKQAILNVSQSGYIMDPHTAVAYHAGQQYMIETGDTTHQVVISTASPFKFAEDVLESLNINMKSDSIDHIKALSKISGLPIPNSIVELTNKKVHHTKVCDIKNMEEEVRSCIQLLKYRIDRQDSVSTD